MTSDNTRDISGRIAGVNLSSFLQMIEMDQKTCTIKIFTKRDAGRIFFLNGNLIDSDTRSLNGLEALYAILSWQNIVIEVEKNVSRKEDAVNLPLMHILMESARYLDENVGTEGTRDPEETDSRPSRSIPLQVLRNKDFCLEIGIRLLLDVDHLSVTFRSTLVGIEHGKYLLLKTPGPDNRVDQELFNGNGLTIKTLYKGTIYAFRSRVLGLISEPSRLMFIAYPGRIEHHELRSHKRFKCNIVAQAGMNGSERGGVIENISKGGCRCVMETFASDKTLLNDVLKDTIAFRCRFPGSDGETGFMGEVKNASRESGEMAVGVQFLHLDTMENVRKSIHDYIQLIEWSSEAV
jgi:c-di-GMP-binding flagellar brake protein YcgR